MRLKKGGKVGRRENSEIYCTRERGRETERERGGEKE